MHKITTYITLFHQVFYSALSSVLLQVFLQFDSYTSRNLIVKRIITIIITLDSLIMLHLLIILYSLIFPSNLHIINASAVLGDQRAY